MYCWLFETGFVIQGHFSGSWHLEDGNPSLGEAIETGMRWIAGDFSFISYRKTLDTKTQCLWLQFNITGDLPVSFAWLLHLIPWTSSQKQSIIVYNFWWPMTSEKFPRVSFLKRLSWK